VDRSKSLNALFKTAKRSGMALQRHGKALVREQEKMWAQRCDTRRRQRGVLQAWAGLVAASKPGRVCALAMIRKERITAQWMVRRMHERGVHEQPILDAYAYAARIQQEAANLIQAVPESAQLVRHAAKEARIWASGAAWIRWRARVVVSWERGTTECVNRCDSRCPAECTRHCGKYTCPTRESVVYQCNCVWAEDMPPRVATDTVKAAQRMRQAVGLSTQGEVQGIVIHGTVATLTFGTATAAWLCGDEAELGEGVVPAWREMADACKRRWFRAGGASGFQKAAKAERLRMQLRLAAAMHRYRTQGSCSGKALAPVGAKHVMVCGVSKAQQAAARNAQLRQRRANEAAAARYAPAAAGHAPLPGSKRWLTIKVVDARALSGTRFQAKIRWAGTSEDGSEDTWEPLTKAALPARRYKEAWRMLEERGITRPADRGMPRANAYIDEAVRSRSKRKGYKQAVGNSQPVPAIGGMPTLSGDQLAVHQGPVPAGVPTAAARRCWGTCRCVNR
jgi:hypothetical protein